MLATGGTIASMESGQGLTPAITSEVPVGGVEKAVKQIPPGVGVVEGDGLLGAGDHNGLGGVLNQVGQGGAQQEL